MEQTVNWEKVYVDTLVRHMKDGGSIPLSIKFSDGKTYEIDQVLGEPPRVKSEEPAYGIPSGSDSIVHSSLKMKACGL
jgi:hypothetical protein